VLVLLELLLVLLVHTQIKEEESSEHNAPCFGR
jgi:hypothetical protein